MLPWVLVFLVLVLAGLGVIGWFAWRLFGDVRHLGATVTDASTRLSAAAAELDAAGGPSLRRDTVPHPRPAAPHRQ
ncbi:hypothetical protein [Embleya scabrispora]|uniref:hypothetical protein n=1 Tax=Embleya scabrispora TaxID=159449 RepID=UPI00036B82D3|nr:hypothetical protein [Embleya scabrispora]MYS81817.1 hypothetical protein [Streptomyces sp. SID5474]